MTPREVFAFCREKDVKAVDLRFADLLGGWQRLTIPLAKLDANLFEEGLGFDGSRLRGGQALHESDMLAVPQSDTAFIDPFAATPTLVLICNIVDPITGDAYSRDPRYIAAKAANYLRSTGIADVAYLGPKVEFYVFDEAEFAHTKREAFFHLGDDLGEQSDIRAELMQGMLDCSLDVEAHHHQATSPGQCQLDLHYQPLVKMADWLMIYKHVARQVARRKNKTATFMPKPLFGERASGMPTHFSLWKEDEPLFAGSGYGGLSDLALYALGGILRHAPALCALTNPTTNSYKRLAPGQDAPVNLAYSQRNRSAACRIPMYSQNPRTKRIEFRCPDSSSNPYLAFAATLMAAIDGIQLKLQPGPPLDQNLYEMPAEQLAEFPKTPLTLDDALRALEADNDFLLRDGVFTPDVLEAWITYKRRYEIDPLRLRPHPFEFELYFDA